LPSRFHEFAEVDRLADVVLAPRLYSPMTFRSSLGEVVSGVSPGAEDRAPAGLSVRGILEPVDPR
jgi:hypothetical protein